MQGRCRYRRHKKLTLQRCPDCDGQPRVPVATAVIEPWPGFNQGLPPELIKPEEEQEATTQPLPTEPGQAASPDSGESGDTSGTTHAGHHEGVSSSDKTQPQGSAPPSAPEVAPQTERGTQVD